jgi:GTP-binding protein Era
MKAGTVAIMGRPNVGKSTLLNALLGEKVAIVSDKPQTTRTRILGVLRRAEAEIAFLDTPGLHKPEHELNRRMIRAAMDAVDEADLLYLVVDATDRPGSGDRFVIREVTEAARTPVFLLINKVDLLKKVRILPLIEQYRSLYAWTEIIPISSTDGSNLDLLLDLTVKALPVAEAVFNEDFLTDQSMRTLAAELIREKILNKTFQELPYSVGVFIDQFVETDKLARIDASVIVDKPSQKAIVVGKGGERLKAVGTEARLDMERLFGMKVFLTLWVKVRPAWRDDEQMLNDLGY